jgi:hypothetical protein
MNEVVQAEEKLVLKQFCKYQIELITHVNAKEGKRTYKNGVRTQNIVAFDIGACGEKNINVIIEMQRIV